MDSWTNIQMVIIAIVSLLLIVISCLLNFSIPTIIKQKIWFVVFILSVITCTYQYKSNVDQFVSGKKESNFIDKQTEKVAALETSEKKLSDNLEKLSAELEKINSSFDSRISKFEQELQSSEKDISSILPFLSAIKENMPIISDRVISSVNGIPSKTASIIQKMQKNIDKQTKAPYINYTGPTWGTTIRNTPNSGNLTLEDMGLQDRSKSYLNMKPNM